MAEEKGQGRGWHGDPEGHARAGKKGGEKVAAERGSEFYSEIGSQQGKENNPGNFANDPEKAKRAGEAGGRARSDRDESDEEL